MAKPYIYDSLMNRKIEGETNIGEKTYSDIVERLDDSTAKTITLKFKKGCFPLFIYFYNNEVNVGFYVYFDLVNNEYKYVGVSHSSFGSYTISEDGVTIVINSVFLSKAKIIYFCSCDLIYNE